jgi:hypothetical protein
MVRNISVFICASLLFFASNIKAMEEEALEYDIVNEIFLPKAASNVKKTCKFLYKNVFASGKEAPKKATTSNNKIEDALDKIAADLKISEKDNFKQDIFNRADSDVTKTIEQDTPKEVIVEKIEQMVEKTSNKRFFDQDIRNKVELVLEQTGINSRLLDALNPGKYPQMKVTSVEEYLDENAETMLWEYRESCNNAKKWFIGELIVLGVGLVGFCASVKYNNGIGAGVSAVASGVGASGAIYNQLYSNRDADTQQKENDALKKMLDTQLKKLQQDANNLKKKLDQKIKK